MCSWKKEQNLHWWYAACVYVWHAAAVAETLGMPASWQQSINKARHDTTRLDCSWAHSEQRMCVYVCVCHGCFVLLPYWAANLCIRFIVSCRGFPVVFVWYCDAGPCFFQLIFWFIIPDSFVWSQSSPKKNGNQNMYLVSLALDLFKRLYVWRVNRKGKCTVGAWMCSVLACLCCSFKTNPF